MWKNIKWPTTQKVENKNKQKHNGRLNLCDHIPKQNLFEKCVFITESYSAVPNKIRLNSAYNLITKVLKAPHNDQ